MTRFIGTTLLSALCSLLFVVPAHAQDALVGISATVANTDFRRSWAVMRFEQMDRYSVSIHAENSGGLPSKDAVVTLVLSSGWKYIGTEGDAGTVRTLIKPYGEIVEWRLPAMNGGEVSDLHAALVLPQNAAPSPVFVSISSAYSVPVYAEVQTFASVEQRPVWSSWLRSARVYAALTAQELWYRFTTGFRFGTS